MSDYKIKTKKTKVRLDGPDMPERDVYTAIVQSGKKKSLSSAINKQAAISNAMEQVDQEEVIEQLSEPDDLPSG